MPILYAYTTSVYHDDNSTVIKRIQRSRRNTVHSDIHSSVREGANITNFRVSPEPYGAKNSRRLHPDCTPTSVHKAWAAWCNNLKSGDTGSLRFAHRALELGGGLRGPPPSRGAGMCLVESQSSRLHRDIKRICVRPHNSAR